MTEEDIDDVIVEIMSNDGPDGHNDGHEIITDFIQSLLKGKGKEWYDKYYNITVRKYIDRMRV